MDMVESGDERIIHAYRIYVPTRDFEGFRARIIHIAAQSSSEYGYSGEERPSSMTTAGFNRSVDYLSRFSRGSSAIYGQRVNQMRPSANRFNRPETRENNSEYGLPTDRYLPIIINFEHQNMLDE